MPTPTPTRATPTPAQEAWALIWELLQANKARMAPVMAEFGLAPMQAMTLRHLRPGEPQPMSAIAEALRCDNSNVTGIVDRLEGAGLVERRPAEHDRRVKCVLLTEQGVTVRAQVDRRMAEPPAALASLTENEAATLRDLLARGLERAD